tara:strand:- start:282 stop:479 length:198 start_codon:yes stop_codon:yes gene_type:complete
MSIGITVSDITFYIYDVESGDEICNSDGSAKTFKLKDGVRFKPLEHICDDMDMDQLEEIKDDKGN